MFIITALPKSPQRAMTKVESFDDVVIDHTAKLFALNRSITINEWKTSLMHAFKGISRMNVTTNSGKYRRFSAAEMEDALYTQPIVGFTAEQFMRQWFEDIKKSYPNDRFAIRDLADVEQYFVNYKTFLGKIGADIESDSYTNEKMYSYLDEYFVQVLP